MSKKLFSSLFFILFAAQVNAYTLSTKAQKVDGKTVSIKMEVDVQEEVDQKADILFVVDDSGSMLGHQNRLSQYIESLVNKFIGYDLQVAVTTTSIGEPSSVAPDGKFYKGFVKSSDVNFVQELKSRILVRPNGSPTEKPFETALKALSLPLTDLENRGFLRDNAKLVIIFATDADDQSNFAPGFFVSEIKKVKPQNISDIEISAIYIPTGKEGTRCYSDDANTSNTRARLEFVLKEFQGSFVNLCSENFATDLEKLGSDIVNKLGIEIVDRYVYELPLVPNISTVAVTYGTITLVAGDFNAGWYYNSVSNTLHIGKLFDFSSQPKGTKLTIEFKSL